MDNVARCVAVLGLLALTLPIMAEKPNASAPALTAKDLQLIKVAAGGYTLSSGGGKFKTVTKLDPADHAELILSAIMKADNPDRTGLATHILLHELMLRAWADRAEKENELLKKVPSKWMQANLATLFDTVKIGDVPTPAQLKRGAIKDLDNLVDNLRENQEYRNFITAAMRANDRLAAEHAEKLAARHGENKLDAEKLLSLRYHQNTGGNEHHFSIAYHGEEPLTNVLVFFKVQTIPISLLLTPGELAILGLNAQLGADDKNPDVAKWMMSNKVPAQLSKGGVVCVPELRKGEWIQFPIGWTPPERIREIVITIRSDNGSLQNYELVKQALVHQKAALEERKRQRTEAKRNAEADAKEKRAASLLAYAKKLLLDPETLDKGKNRLQEVIKDYPDTNAAQDAKELAKMYP